MISLFGFHLFHILHLIQFGAFMVEGTPGMPYGASDLDLTLLSNFNEVEKNMKIRRKEVESLLSKDEALLCITSFPR